MRCPNCGTNNPAGTSFCQHCGMPFTSSSSSQSSAFAAPNVPPTPSSLPGIAQQSKKRSGCLSTLGCLLLFSLLCGGGLWGGFALWGVLSGSTSQYTYKMGDGEITAIIWSPDSTRVASASVIGAEEQSVVQVWDMRSSKRFLSWTALSNVQSLAWSPDGQRLALVGRLLSESGQPSVVQIIDATTGGHALTLHFPDAFAVSWSPDSKYIVVAVSDGEGTSLAQVWDASKGTRVFVENTGHGNSTTVVWSPDGKRIAAGGEDGTVLVWDALTGDHTFLYSGHRREPREEERAIIALAWSPDSQWLASADENVQDDIDESTVQVWQPFTNGSSATYPINARSLAWSSDGTRIVTSNEQIRVWDAHTGGHMFYRTGFADSGDVIPAVAWSPDGTEIASGNGVGGEIEIWQPPSESAFIGQAYYLELIVVAVLTLFISAICLGVAFFFPSGGSTQSSGRRPGPFGSVPSRRFLSRSGGRRSRPRSLRLILLALLVLCLGVILVIGMINFGWNINWWNRA